MDSYFPVSLGFLWLVMQPLNLTSQMSFLPWKGNWLQSHLVLPAFSQDPVWTQGSWQKSSQWLHGMAPGMESGHEELPPLCSSPLWPVTPFSWSHWDWDLSYTSLFQNGAWSGAHEGSGNLCVGVQQAGMGWDLGPVGTEEGQVKQLGWESPAHSWVATYFAGEAHVSHTQKRGVQRAVLGSAQARGVFLSLRVSSSSHAVDKGLTVSQRLTGAFTRGTLG